MEWISGNWIWILLIGGFLAMRFFGGGCCGGKEEEDETDEKGEGTAKQAPRHEEGPGTPDRESGRSTTTAA